MTHAHQQQCRVQSSIPAHPSAEGRSHSALGTQHSAPQETGLYVYCIAGPISSPPPPSQPSVYPIRCGPLSALVADVALDEFSRETLTAHQDDVGWLAERVKHHNNVIRETMRHATILPLRFGTIFTSHDALLEFLTERHPLFTRLLEKFEGRQEWGAKLFYSSAERIRSGPAQQEGGSVLSLDGLGRTPPPTSVQKAVPTQHSALSAPHSSSGRDFLLRKRQQRLREERAKTEAIARAAELHHYLSRRAASSVVLNRSPHTTDDPHTSLIFSASYLVDNEGLPSFLKAAEEFAANVSPHFQATVSGPWPPYSFVSLEDTSTPLPQQRPDTRGDSTDDPSTEWEVKGV